jgi:hypothetical protein
MFVYDGLPSARLPLSIKDRVSDVCALAPAEGVVIARKVKDTRNNDFIIFVLPILHQDCSILVPMTRAYLEPELPQLNRSRMVAGFLRVMKLQRPLADGSLKIVARGEKRDPP